MSLRKKISQSPLTRTNVSCVIEKVLSDEIAARPDASDRGEKLLKSLKNLLEE